MSWSYNSTIARTLDRVRFTIGDTDGGNPQLQDEEIAFLLTDEPDYLDASISAADALAAKYARQVDYAAGPVKEQLMQLQMSYEKLSDRLRRKISRRGIAPFVGGISESARDSSRQDDDLIQPEFTIDMEREPGTDLQGDNFSHDPPFPAF